MKLCNSLLIFILLLAGCTPKQQENNTHREAPTYKHEISVNKKLVNSISEIQNSYKLNKPLVETRKIENLIIAVKSMEAYVLNESNLINPEINDSGRMHPSFRLLIEIYTEALNLLLYQDPMSDEVKQLLYNFKGTVLNQCMYSDRFCEEATAFRTPYAVGVLANLFSKDTEKVQLQISQWISEKEKVEKLNELDQHDDPRITKAIKEVVFNYHILKYFGEVETSLTTDMFIQFSGTFFTYVDVTDRSDAFLNNYMTDLTNVLLSQSRQKPSPKSCSIFNVIKREKFNKLVTTLKSGLSVQLTKHYYACHTPEQIAAKIEADEEERKQISLKKIEEEGVWSGYFKNYHARKHILNENFSEVVSSYGLDKDIPIYLINLMDKTYYGKLSFDEKEILFKNLTEDDLVNYIKLSEVYAKINFLYSMQFTFNAYNEAIQEAYAEHGIVNSKFVQDVYDSLKLKTGDVWYSYKEYAEFLRLGLNDIYSKISPDRKKEVEELYKQMRDHKLESTKVANLINVAVSYPIVLATTYIAGTDGGGTIDIKVTFFGGVVDEVKIPTVRPLEGYFIAMLPNILQLVDYGYRGYQPHELERNYGLGAAIRNGFFETVNLDLGEKNQGTIHNLKLFFNRYVEHNQTWAEFAVREIESMRKIKINHWDRLKGICDAPISSERKILLNDLYDNLYMDTKATPGSVSETDLQFGESVFAKKRYAVGLYNEIQRLKRTYKVIVASLQESGVENQQELVDSMKKAIRPHYTHLNNILVKRSELLQDLDVQGDFCYKALNKMERFQQNLLQRNAVDYVAKLHAAMQLLRKYKFVTDMTEAAGTLTDANEDDEIDNKDVKLTARPIYQAMQEVAKKEATSSADPYQKYLLEELAESKVLRRVVSDLGLVGEEALTEALNLILMPHNMDDEFGYSISGMKVRAKSLDDTDTYLRRQGGFDKSLLILTREDQFFRVREEVKALKASSLDVEKYFAESKRVIDDLATMREELELKEGEEFDVPLNSKLSVKIKNFKSYKDITSIKDAEVKYKADRKEFMISALEALFGLNQKGNQIFNWSQEHIRPKHLGSFYSRNLLDYKNGSLIIPNKIDESDFNLDCALDTPFDQFHATAGCREDGVKASRVVKDFIDRAESFYLGDEELFPLHPGKEVMAEVKAGKIELDEFEQLIQDTYFSSESIANYNPSDTVRYFKYYKRKLEPEEWTWFEGFLAKEFTTGLSKDRLHRPQNVPILPGVYDFEYFMNSWKLGTINDLLLESNTTTIPLFRSYFRSQVMKTINYTDKVIEEMRRAEVNYGNEEVVENDKIVIAKLPEIKFTHEDYQNFKVDPDELRDFVTLKVKERDANSVILLTDVNPKNVGIKLEEDDEEKSNMFEVESYMNNLFSTFEKFHCELMPKAGDIDFDSDLDMKIKDLKSCEQKAKVWIKFKLCKDAQKYAEFNETYNVDLYCAGVE